MGRGPHLQRLFFGRSSDTPPDYTNKPNKIRWEYHSTSTEHGNMYLLTDTHDPCRREIVYNAKGRPTNVQVKASTTDLNDAEDAVTGTALSGMVLENAGNSNDTDHQLKSWFLAPLLDDIFLHTSVRTIGLAIDAHFWDSIVARMIFLSSSSTAHLVLVTSPDYTQSTFWVDFLQQGVQLHVMLDAASSVVRPLFALAYNFVPLKKYRGRQFWRKARSVASDLGLSYWYVLLTQ